MTKIPAPSETSDLDRGYVRSIVTFIDILGFKALLRQSDAGQIKSIMQSLRAFAGGEGERPNLKDEAGGSPAQSRVFSESISDAVVRVRELSDRIPGGPFLAELKDLMRIQIECARRHVLIRGGMTIGRVFSGEAGEGPIFGEGVDRAYEIEEKEALYPRVMVDDSAIALFMQDGALWPNQTFPDVGCDVAEAYIETGEDGGGFVNYLNFAALSFFESEEERVAFWETHRNLILQNANAMNVRTRRKYIWLSNYHNKYARKLTDRYRSMKEAGNENIPWNPERLFEHLHIPGSAFHLP